MPTLNFKSLLKIILIHTIQFSLNKIIYLMYNFFKYQQTVRQQENQRKEEEKYSFWLLKHQDMKQQAKQRQKIKLQEWVNSQLREPVKQHIQDDHYKQWRFIKQFRDVQIQPAFLGFKTFRHKPSHEMNKIFNERERRQIQYLSNKKQKLVDSAKIHQAERKRSLRSQGPLHPKIQFRTLRKEKQLLNPRMRFQNVTDRERMNQTSLTFDDKFKSVYSSFQMKKSKIGIPRISFYNDNENSFNAGRSKSTRQRYDNDIITERSLKLKDSNNYAVNEPQIVQNQQNLAQSKQFTAKLQPLDQKISARKNSTKTMQLNGNKKIRQLLIETQYNRKKDLSNIKMNISCQNYFKRPIL